MAVSTVRALSSGTLANGFALYKDVQLVLALALAGTGTSDCLDNGLFMHNRFH